MGVRVKLDAEPIQYVLDFSNEGELLNKLDGIYVSIRQLSPIMLIIYRAHA